MRFNLRWIFWFVTCCALAVWLLTLPALFSKPTKNWNFTGRGMEGYFSYENVPTHWPLEVSLRLATCTLLFLLPLVVGRWKLAGRKTWATELPRIPLKTFLLSTALLGVGIGCFLAGLIDFAPRNPFPQSGWHRFYLGVRFIAAGAFIGAGLAAPFHRLRWGAYMGFLFQIVAGISYRVLVAGWPRVWHDGALIIVFTVAGLAIAVAALLWRIGLSVRSGKLPQPFVSEALAKGTTADTE